MVRAKFRVTSKKETTDGFEVVLSPVTSGSKENEQYYKYTAAGSCTLLTINSAAANQFEVGKEYYLDFTKAE